MKSFEIIIERVTLLFLFIILGMGIYLSCDGWFKLQNISHYNGLLNQQMMQVAINSSFLLLFGLIYVFLSVVVMIWKFRNKNR